ncbi:MAG: methyl-accepting chemotaxis protein [Desulfobulbus sp.]|jgi:methyl-accepting chemotaxis protein
MLNNLKIGTRLALGFGLITLILLVVGGLGVYEFRNLNASIDELTEYRMPRLTQANLVLDATNEIARAMLGMGLHEDPAERAQYEQILRDAEARIQQQSALLIQGSRTEEGKRQLAATEQLWKSYTAEIHRYIEMTKTKPLAEANQLLLKGPVPQERAKFMEVFSNFIKRQEAETNESAQATEKEVHRAIMLVSILLISGLVISVAMALLIIRSITGPVAKAVQLAEVMAQGDFTHKLEISQQDEIGNMARALNTVVATLNPAIKQIIDGARRLNASSGDLAASSSRVAEGSKDAAQLAIGVAAAAEEMNANVQSVSAAMEQSTSNINMVASSTEEMNATVNEIAQNAERARSISEGAVTQSKVASERMAVLGESAHKIGRVTETITEISEQTNLLALNATIEAARAGEAGKGFAVVANEIKELARQTAEATVDIKDQIGEMQETTKTTVTDIEKISTIIAEINNVINGIATAVEEQSAASSEIATNISQASLGIGEVNENVAQTTVAVSEVTQNINRISEHMRQVATETSQEQNDIQGLVAMAAELDQLTKKFTV